MNTIPTTMILTCNSVRNFVAGPHGNGRVIIQQHDPKQYEGQDAMKIAESLRIMLIFMGPAIESVDQVIVYASASSREKKELSLGMVAAAAAVYGAGLVTVLACTHYIGDFSYIGREHRMKIRVVGCGGEADLERIVSEKLAELSAAPTIEGKEIRLEAELELEPDKEGWSAEAFRVFAEFAGTLWAGTSGGRIFTKKDGAWVEFALKMRQGINVMYKDGETLLVGDGSCCSGAVYRITPDGQYEQILPAEGQGETGREEGNLLGNVYSFARFRGELLCGVGGCSGQHLYRLNEETGRFEFHPADPEEYVMGMFQPEGQDCLYLVYGQSWSSATIRLFDGKGTRALGQVRGSHPAFIAHDGQVYAGGTDGGNCRPTSYSNAEIVTVTPEGLTSVWKAEGGVYGFFRYGGKLYAYGMHQVSYQTEIMELREDGWHKIATLDGVSEIIVHDGVIYAGGCREDKVAHISRLVF